MVGVPGRKPTGCHTCRRRKIKCDKGHPNCLRCVKTGRECEGYERGAVFLNRTVDGLARRQYFDEVQPRKQPLLPVRSTDLPVLPKLDRPMSLTPVLPMIVRGYFLESWIPTTEIPRLPVGGWIVHACLLTRPSVALENSLGALAITAVGWKRGDPAMVEYGAVMYGRALRTLQLALWDAEMAKNEDTLAAVQALKMYEVSQASDDSTSNFDKHVIGATRLLLHRGPVDDPSLLSQALTRDVRHSALMYSMQHMQRNPLGEKEWRTTRWRSLEDVGQGLLDVGFDITGVGENLTETVKESDGTRRAMLAEHFLEAANTTCEALQAWFTSAIGAGWLSNSWPYPKLDTLSTAAPSDKFNGTDGNVDLSTLREALMMIEYWALQISLGALILGLRSHSSPVASIPRRCEEYGRAFQIQKAKDILAVMPYVCRPEHGFVFSSRSIFPARVTQYVLRIHRGPELTDLAEQAEEFVAFLSDRRGIKYAAVLATGSGKWREGERDVSSLSVPNSE